MEIVPSVRVEVDDAATAITRSSIDTSLASTSVTETQCESERRGCRSASDIGLEPDMKRLAALILVLATSGCMAISGRLGEPEPYYPCSPSSGMFALDAIGAGYFTANSIVLGTMSDRDLRRYELNPDQRPVYVALSGALAATALWSAVKGSEYNTKCRYRMQRDFERKQEEARQKFLMANDTT